MPHSDYIDRTDEGLAKPRIAFKNHIAGERAARGRFATEADRVQPARAATRFRRSLDFNGPRQSAGQIAGNVAAVSLLYPLAGKTSHQCTQMKHRQGKPATGGWKIEAGI